MRPPARWRRIVTALGVALLTLLLLASAAYPDVFAGPPTTPGWGEPEPAPALPADLADLPFQAQLVFDTETGTLQRAAVSGYFASWWRPGAAQVVTFASGRLALFDAAAATWRASGLPIDAAFGSWSPDGRAVVAEGTTPDGRRTYRVGAETGAGRQVGKVDFEHAWSPDGRWLATLDGFGRSVVFQPVDPGEAASVAPIHHRGSPAAVSWVDDGRVVIVMRGDPSIAYLVEPGAARPIRAAVRVMPGQVTAGPGGWFAVAQVDRVYLYDGARLGITASIEARRNPNWTSVSWSPDGSRVAVMDGKRLLLLDAATGHLVVALPHTVAYDWTPAGELIGWVMPCVMGGLVSVGPDGRLEDAGWREGDVPSLDGRWLARNAGERLIVLDAVSGLAALDIGYPQGFAAFAWSDDSRYLSFRAGGIEAGGPCVGDGPLGP